MEAWSLNSNLTLMMPKSRLTSGLAAITMENSMARVGEEPATTATWCQSPYWNVGLSYRGLENGYEAGLFYNVRTKLVSVGINYTPDVCQCLTA